MRIGDDILCLHTLSDTEDLPRQGGDGQPLRAALDRPLGLPAVVSPPRWACCWTATMLQPVHLHRRPRGEPENASRRPPGTCTRSPATPAQNADQQGLDRGVFERGALERADLGALPLQRDGMERREGGTQAHQERGGQPARPDGVQAEAQHGGRAHALLGGDTGQRGGLPLQRRASYTFIPQALCFFTEETNYKDSLSPFGIKMADRMTGRPLHLDICDLPMKKGVIYATATSLSSVRAEAASRSS